MKIELQGEINAVKKFDGTINIISPSITSPSALPQFVVPAGVAIRKNITSLEEATWAEISAISASGKASEIFSVGDSKRIHIQGRIRRYFVDFDTYAYIIGIDHNPLYEGQGIHFALFRQPFVEAEDIQAYGEFMDAFLALPNYTYDHDYGGEVHSTLAAMYQHGMVEGDLVAGGDDAIVANINHDTNYGRSVDYGGWSACDMRYDTLGSTDIAPAGYWERKTINSVGYDATPTCATNPVPNTLMACLPAELRAVMQPMIKYTDNVTNGIINDSESITRTIDYLPLLSEFEAIGKDGRANIYEKNRQAQYDYFKSHRTALGCVGVSMRASSTGVPELRSGMLTPIERMVVKAPGATEWVKWWTRSPTLWNYNGGIYGGFSAVYGGKNLRVSDKTSMRELSGYELGIYPVFKI